MSSLLQTYQSFCFCFASNILNNPGAYNMISILLCSLSIIVVERGVYVSRWSPPGAWSWCGGGSGGSHGRCSPTPPPCHRDTPRACTNHSSDTGHVTRHGPITAEIQVTWQGADQSQLRYRSRDEVQTNHSWDTGHVLRHLPITAEIQVTWRGADQSELRYRSHDEL